MTDLSSPHCISKRSHWAGCPEVILKLSKNLRNWSQYRYQVCYLNDLEGKETVKHVGQINTQSSPERTSETYWTYILKFWLMQQELSFFFSAEKCQIL